MRPTAILLTCVSLSSLLAGAVGVEAGSAGGADRGHEQRRADEARTATIARVEQAIRQCVNRNRRDAGLEPLLPSRPLSRAARLQARNMKRFHFFDHTDPQGRGPLERVQIFDHTHRYSVVGENIAAGYPSAGMACEGWMGSPGHRQNILRPSYTSVGAGFSRGGEYGRYYVQVFGG
jgi:uncharacterized protein YkwD